MHDAQMTSLEHTFRKPKSRGYNTVMQFDGKHTTLMLLANDVHCRRMALQCEGQHTACI